MQTIQNPIIKGFNPDPSIIRVGEDYYIATSTFFWSPGVAVYHSRDLQNWDLIARPLNRLSQLNLYGVEPSGGVFAPCLSYCDGVFYLMYTNVLAHLTDFMECHNYLVTASDIKGPWSEPVYIHSIGFDPSLFHDDDGRKYVQSVRRRYRVDEDNCHMSGIIMQEYDPVSKSLVGPIKCICEGIGSGLHGAEGPHIYKHGGYYHLLIAEGGTQYGHATSMFRAKDIWGPYESHPDNPILTARDDLTLPLQRAGHSDLVDTPQGETYMVHLCGRPLPPDRRCILGRETAIQKAEWGKDGWLRLVNGYHPELNIPAPAGSGPITPPVPVKKRYAFSLDTPLDPDFLFLRNRPAGHILSLTARPGFLRLIGQDSPNSRFTQTVTARRQTAFNFIASTQVIFNPISERQMAGLIYIYDEDNFCYAHVTRNWHNENILCLMCMERKKAMFFQTEAIDLPPNGVTLKLDVRGDKGQFTYNLGRKDQPLGPEIEASKLSDEYPYYGDNAYTGAMVGMACHDMQYRNAIADFSWFEYIEGQS